MHGGRGHMDPLYEFGDPFACFGCLMRHHKGQDPFHHPFFTDAFGGLSESHPYGFSGGGPIMYTHPPCIHVCGSPFMNAPPPHFPTGGSPFRHAHPPGFPIRGRSFMNAHSPDFPIGDSPFLKSPLPFGFGTQISAMNVQPSDVLKRNSSRTNRSKGLIIEELNFDDEKEIDGKEEKKDNPIKHDRSEKEAYVVDQDYQTEGRNEKKMLCCDDDESRSANDTQLGAKCHSSTNQSFSVMHGGSYGAYCTKYRTSITGTDGLTTDESKEADSTPGQAAQRLSRGTRDIVDGNYLLGHTGTRNLQSTGKVDTMQIVHNLDKDDLAGFEQTWKINDRKSLLGSSEGLYMQNEFNGRAGDVIADLSCKKTIMEEKAKIVEVKLSRKAETKRRLKIKNKQQMLVFCLVVVFLSMFVMIFKK